MTYTVEAFQQFLRWLAGPPPRSVSLRLPPHVDIGQVVKEAELLVRAISNPVQKDVKKYAQFEQFFSFQWEFLLPVDALDVAFQRWQLDTRETEEPEKGIPGQEIVFAEGQVWRGLYYCTQGPTSISLWVKEVTRRSPRSEGNFLYVEADLTFEQADLGKGGYTVAGPFDLRRGIAVLDPIAKSWNKMPANFAMVGLHGVATRHGNTDGTHRFAGVVPVFGCDSFELKANPRKDGDEGPAADPAADALEAAYVASQTVVYSSAEIGSWSALLARLSRELDAAREKWRDLLHAFLVEGATKKASSSSNSKQDILQLMPAGLGAEVAKLLRAANAGDESTNKINFELTTGEDGEAPVVILRLGDQEAHVQMR